MLKQITVNTKSYRTCPKPFVFSANLFGNGTSAKQHAKSFDSSDCFAYEILMHDCRDSVYRDEIPTRLTRVVDYIRNHYREDLNLNTLAGVACLSKFHFHRLFYGQFRETASNYLKRIRLEQAVRYLATDADASIAQVADACGFSSSQNFARAFTAQFGYPPSSVRKNPERYRPGLKASLSSPASQKTPLAVEIRNWPSRRVAYIRDIGPYGSESNSHAIDRLYQWAVHEGHADVAAGVIGVCWSDFKTTSPRHRVFDACLAVDENAKGGGDVRIQLLPGGRLAILHCEEPWDEIPAQRNRFLNEWLPSSEYVRDERPFFFMFYNNPHMNRLTLTIVDLCLPVKQ